jgi:hypothetical protein
MRVFISLLALGMLTVSVVCRDKPRQEDSTGVFRADSIRAVPLDSLEVAEIAGTDDWSAIAAEQEELTEYVAHLAEHPIDLNRASMYDLESIPYVTESEAKSILDLRQLLGRYTSREQLVLLDGDGELLRRKVSPFVAAPFGSRHSVSARLRATDDASHSWEGVSTVEESRSGVVHARVNGRISRLFEMGMLIERQELGDVKRQPVGGYLEFHDAGVLTHAVAGDFTLQTGNGVAFSSSRRVMSSPAAGAPPGRNDVIRGIAGRSRFFRGIAGQIGIRVGRSDLMVGGFIARFMESSDVEALPAADDFMPGIPGGSTVWSALAPTTIGGVVESTIGNVVRFGATCAYTPIHGVEEAGVHVVTSLRNALLYGEVVRSGGGAGLLAGVVLNTGEGSRLSIIARSYERDFTSFGSPICQFGDSQNEKGVYLGWDCHPARRVRISGYLDLFARLSRTRLSLFPVQGRELLAECLLDPSEWYSIRLQWRERLAERTSATVTASELPEKVQDRFVHRRISATAVFRKARPLELSTTVKYVCVGGRVNEPAHGVLLSHVLTWRTPLHLTLALRVNSFFTDSYDARVYAPEGTLPGMFSTTPLYGKGRLWYLRADWRVSASVSLAARYEVKEDESGVRNRRNSRSFGMQLDVKI